MDRAGRTNGTARVRPALSGLTNRGQAFLAAGLACVAASVALGEVDLLRVGLLLLVLPVIALVLVNRARYRLSCTRRLEPGRAPAGAPAGVLLRLENLSRIPTGMMLFEDRLPFLLGGRPRFVVDRLEAGGRRDVRYSVRSDLRGRYPIGPLTVRLADPFGLCELTRAFQAVDHLTITPVVWPLPPVRLAGGRGGSGDSHARWIATQGEDDVTTREYRQGDELRRVHWRSTARHGELMVRREERPWQSTAMLLLDVRSRGHRGDGPGSSVEWAISAAASIGTRLDAAGYSVRLVTDSGVASEVAEGGARYGRSVDSLLDSLAVLRLSPGTTLEGGLAVVRRDGGEGLYVAVCGTLDPASTTALARSRTGGTVGIAVLVDSVSWSGTSQARRVVAAEAYRDSVQTLRRAGWRVLPVSYGDTLASVWPQVAADREPAMTAGGVG